MSTIQKGKKGIPSDSIIIKISSEHQIAALVNTSCCAQKSVKVFLLKSLGFILGGR